MANTVGVPIDADLYAEFILRSGKSVDVANWIENILQDYMDRTEFEDLIWSKDHIEKVRANLDEDFEATYGDPEGSYRWGELWLWNGTRIRMNYKGKNHYAFVRDEQIIFEEEAYTPSQLASKIAGGTNRNAWRDLWIMERESKEWVLAYDLRRKAKSIRPIGLDEF